MGVLHVGDSISMAFAAVAFEARVSKGVTGGVLFAAAAVRGDVPTGVFWVTARDCFSGIRVRGELSEATSSGIACGLWGGVLNVGCLPGLFRAAAGVTGGFWYLNGHEVGNLTCQEIFLAKAFMFGNVKVVVHVDARWLGTIGNTACTSKSHPEYRSQSAEK